MATTSSAAPKAETPGVAQLVGGIVTDAQALIKQQMALLRHETQEDLRKTKEAGCYLACGGAIAAVGLLLLCHMIAHGISMAVPEVPLWGSFGIVGGIASIVGGTLILIGVQKLKSFNPLPDESGQALKENVEWIAKPN